MSRRPSNTPFVGRLQALSRLAALLAIAVGCLVIAGWLFNIEIFKTVLPGFVAMKFNTALAFMLAGIGLLNLQKQPRITQAMAVLVTLLGLLTFCEYFFGWNLGIDQWLVHDAVTPLSNYPGRMSPVTAFNFCLMGSSLLLVARSRRLALAQSLMLVAVFIAMLSLTGYIYGVKSLYKIGVFSSIALHTTLTFIIFGLGILFANPEHGLTAIIVADRPGALLVRRFLPATIVISLLLAWLQQKGQEAGFYDVNFGLALFAMSNIIIFALLIFWNAHSLNDVDHERRQAAQALRRVNEELELRVGERTSELTEANRTLEAQIVQRKSADDRFRALLESAPDAVIIASSQGEIILVNAQTERIFGYTRDELLGQAIEMLISEPFRSRHPAHRSEYAAEPQVRSMGVGLDLYALRKDGSQFPVEISLSPIKTEEGTVIASSVRDITERKRADEVLNHERNMLRTLIDHMPDYIFIKDKTKRFILSNVAQAHAAGVASPSELLGFPADIFFPAEVVAQPNIDDDAVLRGENIIAQERQTVNADGTLLWISTTKVPLRDAQGNVIGIVGISRNISERKQAEDALRASEEKLQAIFNLLPVGTSIINNERRIISMNPTQEKILGMTLDDIMSGKYLARQYLHGDGSPVLAGEFTSSRALAEQRVIFDDEIGFIKEDGMTVWTTVSAAPLPGNQGLVMVMADMTERKHVEQEMERLHIALNTVEEGAQMIGFDWRYIYLNDAAAAQGQGVKEEMLGRTMMDIYPGIDQTPLFDVLRRCMQQRVAEHMENPFTFLDKSTGWFDLSVQPIPEGIFILSTNISERKRAEEAIRHSEQLLRTILDNLPIGVSITDADGAINQMNPAGRQIWAMDKNVDISGYGERKGWWIDTGEFIQPNDWAGMRAITKGEISFNEEIEIECLDGAHKFILNSAIPMRDNQQQITGAILVNQDVTKIKGAEIALQKLNDDLHHANEEVQNFAYIVSHDLRAPLINLKGFSDLLRASVAQIDKVSESILPLLDETQRIVLNTALHEKIPTALRFINTSVSRMDGFTSSILKLSRIGHHQLSYETIIVNDLVSSILQSLAGQISEQGIEFSIEELPNIRADRTSLDQILGNIITNAMKYLDPARPGRIRIYSESVSGNTTIHVQDNGRGIAEVDYEKIFAPFRRAGRPTVEGEGMGLAYVQALLKRHQGHIWFTSTPNIGSTFSFTIPTKSEAKNDAL